ncbi:MAG: trigger factor [Capnocytophaga sp.]|nr:trigger factor [Capnocytophaga sp.]
MKITKEQIDNVNAVLSVSIEKADYSQKVENALNNYRKNASIPGFRKGHIPMGMIRKQYGRAVQVDEINKLLQEAIHNYITSEKLDILGNPLPKQTDVDWEAETLTFNFELGLAPKFELNLAPKDGFTLYEITPTKEDIEEQLERILTEQGDLIPAEKISKNSQITGTFFNEAKNIDKNYSFDAHQLSQQGFKALENKQVGDQIQLQTKDLFSDAHMLMYALGVSHDEVHHLEIEVTFTIEDIKDVKLAEINEEFFKKIAPNGEVKTEEELRAKIEEGLKNQYETYANQQFLDNVTNTLVEETTFELPEAFLKRWLRTAGEKELTEEEAEKEFERSQKGLRYQLIEGKIVNENNLNVSNEELRAFTEDAVRNYFRNFGVTEPTEEQVKSFTANILKNNNEVDRLYRELLGKKLLDFYKQTAKINKKAVTFKEFEEIELSK